MSNLEYVVNYESEKYYVGAEFLNKNGDKFVILGRKVGGRGYIIKFIETGYVRTATTNTISEGKIKDSYKKTVHGVATKGDYVCKTDFDKTIYKTWYKLIERVYNFKDKDNYKTYKNVSVCEEWLFFENFLNWYKSNYIEGYDLDKDLKQLGMEYKVYSPETCIFLPHDVNTVLFSGTNRKNNTSGEIGISFSESNNKYRVYIIDFLSKKQKYIGLYKNIEEAVIFRDIEYKKRDLLIVEYLKNTGNYSEDILNIIKNRTKFC